MPILLPPRGRSGGRDERAEGARCWGAAEVGLSVLDQSLGFRFWVTEGFRFVEARIMSASNDFNLFETKVDKICHRIDMLENKVLQIYSSR